MTATKMASSDAENVECDKVERKEVEETKAMATLETPCRINLAP